MNKFDLNQNISPHLAIIFLMVLSFAVAWYTVSFGQRITEEMENSAVVNVNARNK